MELFFVGVRNEALTKKAGMDSLTAKNVISFFFEITFFGGTP